MSQKNYAAILGFTDKWFALGIVTKESLVLSGAAYESSDDKSSEHYRYGAFRWFLSQHRPLLRRRSMGWEKTIQITVWAEQ